MSAPVNVSWRGWAGLVVAPTAWAIHHQAGSDLNFTDCRTGDASLLIPIGLAMLALALLGGGLSLTAWRAGRKAPQDGSARFIPTLGVMAGALFSLVILVQTAAAVILPPCFR
jgi:hypothetical protein